MKRYSFLILFLAFAHFLQAQNTFSIAVSVQPLPSPYVNDWYLDPTLTHIDVAGVVNTPQDIVIRVEVENESGWVMTGRSKVISLPPGRFVQVINNTDYVEWGAESFNPEVDDLVKKEGRIPDGTYQVCAFVEDAYGQSPLANSCAPFIIQNPDPPVLLFPVHASTTEGPNPLLQFAPINWTYSPVHYQLHVTEVLSHQTKDEAAALNPPHLSMELVDEYSTFYPDWGMALDSGKTYCWWVQAFDPWGVALGERAGMSEVWVFEVGVDSVVKKVDQKIKPELKGISGQKFILYSSKKGSKTCGYSKVKLKVSEVKLKADLENKGNLTIKYEWKIEVRKIQKDEVIDIAKEVFEKTTSKKESFSIKLKKGKWKLIGNALVRVSLTASTKILVNGILVPWAKTVYSEFKVIGVKFIMPCNKVFDGDKQKFECIIEPKDNKNMFEVEWKFGGEGEGKGKGKGIIDEESSFVEYHTFKLKKGKKKGKQVISAKLYSSKGDKKVPLAKSTRSYEVQEK